MKRLNNYRIPSLLAAFIISSAAYTQDSIAKQPLLDVMYFSYNNNIPYVQVMARLKQGRRFEPIKGVTLKVYLDSISSSSLMTDNAVTDETGKADVAMPPSLQKEWNAYSKHQFIAEASGVKEFEGQKAVTEITKARLLIDTATAGETKNINFTIDEKMLRFYNEDLQYISEPGDFNVMIGGSSNAVKESAFVLQ